MSLQADCDAEVRGNCPETVPPLDGECKDHEMPRNPNLLYRHDGHQWHRAECVLCHECGLEFLAMIKEIKKGGGKFCSRQCQRAHQAKINAQANKTVGLTAAERKKQWVARTSSSVTRAHKQVETAISNGSLLRMPCEICGKHKVDAHHDDY